ncbi:MAG: ABC transporter permease [Anaerolinea sp.]|nr:ABC transporter permease [Anaerolinea sp.]
MRFFESFRIAVTSLLLNRTRALLTMLGIIIGVGAVVSLISLGRGVQDYVVARFEGLGADILTVRGSPPARGFFQATNPLTMVDVEALADEAVAPDVNQIAADYTVQGTVVDGYASVTVTVRGVTGSYFAVQEWLPGVGSLFTSQDIEGQAQIALLGSTVVEDLYGDASYDPTGKTIRINDLAFVIVGVMEERTATMQDPNNAILVPISTAQARLGNARIAGEGYRVSTIYAQVSETASMDAATEQIEAYLLDKHGISDPDQADFDVTSAETIAESRTAVLETLTLFLSGIAAISLLVGGIGVMNIMLVSVSERTQEIGLRKAVGAQHRDILSQFLIESVLLSLFGGAGGIAVSWAVLQAAPRFISGVTFSLSPDVVLLATGVSSGIGIFFGLFPANRAARLNPIQALRFE